MKKVVDFFKGIEIEDVAIVFLLSFVGLLTAVAIIALPAALVAGDYCTAFMAGVTIVATLICFWIPWYLDRD
jgi:hypothetical protein